MFFFRCYRLHPGITCFSLVTAYTHALLAFHWPWFTPKILVLHWSQLTPTNSLCPVIILLIFIFRWMYLSTTSAELIACHGDILHTHTHTHTHTYIYIYISSRPMIPESNNTYIYLEIEIPLLWGMTPFVRLWRMSFRSERKNTVKVIIAGRKIINTRLW